MDNKILRDISYGMYIIATQENTKLSGCVINTLCQITSSPDNIVSISLNKNNYTNEVLKRTKKASIMILSEKTNKELIKTFGYNSSKNINKFQNLEIEIIDNTPIIKDEFCGFLIIKIINIIDVGTHDIFISKITNSKKTSNSIPMTYRYYKEVLKGTSPKNAPTYQDNVSQSNASVYECTICGHIYDDAKEKIPFVELPDDWTCPVCGDGKDKFKKIS